MHPLTTKKENPLFLLPRSSQQIKVKGGRKGCLGGDGSCTNHNFWFFFFSQLWPKAFDLHFLHIVSNDPHFSEEWQKRTKRKKREKRRWEQSLIRQCMIFRTYYLNEVAISIFDAPWFFQINYCLAVTIDHCETIIKLKNHGQKEKIFDARQHATKKKEGPQGTTTVEVVESIEIEKVSFAKYFHTAAKQRKTFKRTPIEERGTRHTLLLFNLFFVPQWSLITARQKIS